MPLWITSLFFIGEGYCVSGIGFRHIYLIGLCAMQYSQHNYVTTILKTHFFSKTLHHVKKNISSGNDLQL